MATRSGWSTQASFLCALTLALIASGCGASYSTATRSPTVSITVTPARTAIATGATTRFSATGDPAGVTWSVANSSAGATGAVGSIDASGNYTAPSGAQSVTVVVIATSKTDRNQSTLAIVNVVAPGVFTSTNNVQVAQYTVSPAASANVSVQFGLDMTYGLTTWTQPTPASGGGAVSLYVAGMKAGTLYHMRGVVQFSDGSQFLDKDQTFTTGALPAAKLPNLAVTTAPGMTPQSGVELINFIQTNGTTQFPLVVSDLNGNVLWAYDPGLPLGDLPNPIKLLPNGNFLINFSGHFDSSFSKIRELDLAGNIVWDLTPAQLNAGLASATCAECNVRVVETHHDFVLLPNGHLILLTATQQTLSDGTVPTGDVIIDLDENHNPVWVWNEFNHLDTNRRPFMYPDWTHSNALLYSPDDGNLIISIRHQNWLVKIDYNNGHGAGDILWRLGYQGDFALLNPDGTADTNPTDWFYAQHGPSFPSATTSGRFPLILFDNGDDRGVSVVPGGTCGVTGQPACFSTVMLLQLDEAAKTATLAFHPTVANYSFFGGNAEVLKNGDVEYNECATSFPANNAAVHEITQGSSPQDVWQMQITGQFAYRAMRLPSFYPGVQW